MRCKNCNDSLRTDYQFCPACGAKVIRNRLSIRGLIEDFKDRFLNIDNTLFRTVMHLFIKPDVVVLDYIDGVRGRYLNPVSYITLAIALMAAQLYIQTTFFPDILNMKELLAASGNGNSDVDKAVVENTEKMVQFMSQNLYLITFSTIPFLALISKLVFGWKLRHLNYSEHFVLNTYLYSHASVISVIIYFCAFWSKEAYYWAAMLASPIMILYYMFACKRIFDLSFIGIIVRTLFFALIGSVFLFVASVVVMLLIFVIPEIREMFVPAKEVALNYLPDHFLV